MRQFHTSPNLRPTPGTLSLKSLAHSSITVEEGREGSNTPCLNSPITLCLLGRLRETL